MCVCVCACVYMYIHIYTYIDYMNEAGLEDRGTGRMGKITMKFSNIECLEVHESKLCCCLTSNDLAVLYHVNAVRPPAIQV